MAALRRLLPANGQWLLASGLAVALVATAGSLFLSEVWGLVPCELCWYQRILMYPLVVVFGVGFYERRAGVARTVLPLSVPGALVAGITPGYRSVAVPAVSAVAAVSSSTGWNRSG